MNYTNYKPEYYTYGFKIICQTKKSTDGYYMETSFCRDICEKGRMYIYRFI